MRKFQLLVVCTLIVGGVSSCSSPAPRNETAQTNPQRPVQRQAQNRPSVSPQTNPMNGPAATPAGHPSSYVSSSPGTNANTPVTGATTNSSEPAVNRSPNQPLLGNRPNPRAAAEIGSGEAASSATALSTPNAAGEAGGGSAESNDGSVEVAESAAQPTGKTGTGLGDLIPEIEGKDFDGERFALSDYEGKVLMIDFWGDW